MTEYVLSPELKLVSINDELFNFKELREYLDNYQFAFAIWNIFTGYPNKYIWNPGIGNNYNGTPLLAFISNTKDIEWIESVLEAGCDPNLPGIWPAKDNDVEIKIYPLMRAFEINSIEKVNLLLKYGANPKNIDMNEELQDNIWSGQPPDCILT